MSKTPVVSPYDPIDLCLDAIKEILTRLKSEPHTDESYAYLKAALEALVILKLYVPEHKKKLVDELTRLHNEYKRLMALKGTQQ
jgi:hypothetical protein